MNLGLFRHQVKWPVTQPPEWAPKVERWYQLDPAAYVMADAYWTYREQLQEKPLWLLLASPAASNFTDHQFATTASSPAKFVHTLPNIRGCSLLQLMNWTGQVLCLQRDPATVVFALSEAFRLAETEEKTIWVASSRSCGTAHEWCAEIYTVGREGYLEVRQNSSAPPSTQDDEWYHWLEGSERKFVADGYEIIKK